MSELNILLSAIIFGRTLSLLKVTDCRTVYSV